MSDFNLGTVTAYGYAKDKGYTGTEDEYAELMASYADVAEQAAESAEQAAASATTATAKASEAAQSATAAASSKTAAETAQGGAETAAQTATTKAGEASTAATTATNKATEATTAATTATGKATEAAGSATTATTKAGEASASATNAAASATRAQEILDSIPEDYSQLSDDVSDLKDGLTAVESDVTDLKEDFQSTRNLFFIDKLENNNIVVENGVATGTAAQFNAYVNGIPNIGITFDSSTQYTVSLIATNKGTKANTNGLQIRFIYTDQTANVKNMSNQSDNTQYSFTSASGKTLSAIGITYSSAGANTWELSNFQIEKGTTRTDYIRPLSAVDGIVREQVSEIEASAWIDRGVVANLGYTALTGCVQNGIYRSGAAYVSSISDMPSDYTGGAFNLYVTYPSFAANTWIRQELTDANGNSWSRILNYVNNAWTVYNDWAKLALDGEKVDKTVFDSIAYRYQNMSPFFNANSYWDISGGEKAVYTSFTGPWRASNPIDVKVGEKYRYSANQGSTTKARLWVVTDDDYNIISMADDHYGATVVTLTFTIPEGGTKLLLMQYESTYRRLYKIVGYGDKPLEGMHLSLLGDSISSFSGYVPTGNDVYYNGTSNGIGSVNQMWWNVLCEETGMTPLVIDAWSGSGVCYNYATDSSHSDTKKIPMCSDLRTGRLASGGVNPDIIIVTGGTNDWTYSKQTTTPLGDWDGRTAISREDVLSGNSTFMKSYASMIDKLHENYPNAIVVCASMFYTCRGTDLGVTRVNDMGYTESDYSDAVKKVCGIMGVPYIDIYNVGFTFDNYYPTYAQDSNTEATHPNAKGHLVIAKRFIEELPKVVKQFTDVG